MDGFLAVLQGLYTWSGFKAILAIFLAVLVEVIGINWLAYQVLFIMVTIDFITGFTCAAKNCNLSSRKASRTVYKLLIYILLVIAAHQLTRYAFYLEWLEHTIVVYLGITEMLSIIENAHRLGVPIPIWITEKLSSYLQKDKHL